MKIELTTKKIILEEEITFKELQEFVKLHNLEDWIIIGKETINYYPYYPINYPYPTYPTYPQIYYTSGTITKSDCLGTVASGTYEIKL